MQANIASVISFLIIQIDQLLSCQLIKAGRHSLENSRHCVFIQCSHCHNKLKSDDINKQR